MLETLARIFKESLQDNVTGRYSHSRVIAMFIALAATVFMWKLIILGGMSIEYFLAYLAYGTGYQGMNKFLDNKDGARTDQARILNKSPLTQTELDNIPKPPKF